MSSESDGSVAGDDGQHLQGNEEKSLLAREAGNEASH